jgi:hypothetical protein
LLHIAWQFTGQVKPSVLVSNGALALTGTSLRFFTRPTRIFLFNDAFHIVWNPAGRVKQSVPVSNGVLILTGTSLRFFTRPTLIFYLIMHLMSFGIP